jgi:hypothetical protein
LKKRYLLILVILLLAGCKAAKTGAAYEDPQASATPSLMQQAFNAVQEGDLPKAAVLLDESLSQPIDEPSTPASIPPASTSPHECSDDDDCAYGQKCCWSLGCINVGDGCPCLTPSDCDDNNPCTSDICDGDRFCQNIPLETETSCGTNRICCNSVCCQTGEWCSYTLDNPFVLSCVPRTTTSPPPCPSPYCLTKCYTDEELKNYIDEQKKSIIPECISWEIGTDPCVGTGKRSWRICIGYKKDF